MNNILITAVDYFFRILSYALLIRVLLSWFPMVHNAKPVRLLFSVTEPILAPVRNLIRRSPLGGPGMVLDFSPIIVFFLIDVVRNIIISFLMGILR
ncbi:MAG: YggT family protein [Clostridiales bacterium]|jgi:YggT family protein|nr:YggT family protein [Clostridiales bacterium]